MDMEAIIKDVKQKGKAIVKINDIPIAIQLQMWQGIPYYLVRAVEQKPTHAVFFQHGYTKDKDFALPTCLSLAARGFLAIAIDARLHGQRRPACFAEYFCPERFVKSMAEVIDGTVQDISALLTHIQEQELVQYRAAGISGFSMGGYVSYMLPLTDNRFTVAAPVSGSPRWIEPGITDKAMQALLHKLELEPLRQVAKLSHVAWLIQHGEADPVVPIAGSRQFFTAIKPYYADSKRVEALFYPGVEHDYTLAMQDALVDWFCKHLHKNKKAL